LRTCNKPDIKSILFLSGNIRPDYLRCLTLHGFKTIFKDKCHDYPAITHIYHCNIDSSGLYGKGFSYYNLLDPEIYYDINADNTMEQDIANRKYDLIIYGSYTRGMPLYEYVLEYYKSDEIILLFGEDQTIDEFSHIFVDPENPIFIREW
jgi:hypothetical protein